MRGYVACWLLFERQCKCICYYYLYIDSLISCFFCCAWCFKFSCEIYSPRENTLSPDRLIFVGDATTHTHTLWQNKDDANTLGASTISKSRKNSKKSLKKGKATRRMEILPATDKDFAIKMGQHNFEIESNWLEKRVGKFCSVSRQNMTT